MADEDAGMGYIKMPTSGDIFTRGNVVTYDASRGAGHEFNISSNYGGTDLGSKEQTYRNLLYGLNKDASTGDDLWKNMFGDANIAYVNTFPTATLADKRQLKGPNEGWTDKDGGIHTGTAMGGNMGCESLPYNGEYYLIVGNKVTLEGAAGASDCKYIVVAGLGGVEIDDLTYFNGIVFSQGPVTISGKTDMATLGNFYERVKLTETDPEDPEETVETVTEGWTTEFDALLRVEIADDDDDSRKTNNLLLQTIFGVATMGSNGGSGNDGGSLVDLGTNMWKVE